MATSGQFWGDFPHVIPMGSYILIPVPMFRPNNILLLEYNLYYDIKHSVVKYLRCYWAGIPDVIHFIFWPKIAPQTPFTQVAAL